MCARALILGKMSRERLRYRISSSTVAFFAAAAPLCWFFLGVVAGADVTWWLGVDATVAAVVGLGYGYRSYSVSRLWAFVRAVWKGLGAAVVALAVAFSVVFGASLWDLQRPELLAGRLFVGGLGFVLFAVVYGSSYRTVYVESR